MLIINQIKKLWCDSSNLCAEIMEVTDKDTTAICTLTSIPLQKFIVDGVYDLMS
jgi:hypothetical protein